MEKKGLEVIGGVGSRSTGSPSGRGSGYLGLMYSQAPVRSDTELGCRGTTPRKGEDIRSRTEIPHVGPLQATLDPGHGLPLLIGPLWWKGYRPRVRPKREPKGTKRMKCSLMLTTLSGVTFKVSLSVAKFDRFEDLEDQVMGLCYRSQSVWVLHRLPTNCHTDIP